MFGASEDEAAFDHSDDQDNGKYHLMAQPNGKLTETVTEIAELKKESEALKKIRESVGSEEFPELLFDKVFKADIERLRSLEDMWKTRSPPQPLDYKTLMGQATEALAAKEAIIEDDQKVWSLEESLAVFNDSLDRLSKRMLELKTAQAGSGPAPIIEFDKDDIDTLDFVAASANIRSTIFGIERKSRFDIKQMAGNIIPAIATTNAIVAGLCVLQAFKVLRGEYGKVKEVRNAASLSFTIVLRCSYGVRSFCRLLPSPYLPGSLLPTVKKSQTQTVRSAVSSRRAPASICLGQP